MNMHLVRRGRGQGRVLEEILNMEIRSARSTIRKNAGDKEDDSN